MRLAGPAFLAHGLSCSAARGVSPDQGSNPCRQRWQADSGQPGQLLPGSVADLPWDCFCGDEGWTAGLKENEGLGGSCTFSPQEAPAFRSNGAPREAAFPSKPASRISWSVANASERLGREGRKEWAGRDAPGAGPTEVSGPAEACLQRPRVPLCRQRPSRLVTSSSRQSSPRPSPSFCRASALAHTQPLPPLSLTVSSRPSPSISSYPQTQSKESLRTMVLHSRVILPFRRRHVLFGVSDVPIHLAVKMPDLFLMES